MTGTRNYIVNENCTRCGTCARVCPAENISVGESVRFGDKCEWCLGCVHICPLLLSLKLQDLETFSAWETVLPFYRNVAREGIRIHG